MPSPLMDRLENLRDVPDAAWSDKVEQRRRAPRTPDRRPSLVLLPLRVLRAVLRDPGRVWLMSRMVATYVQVSVLARRRSLPHAFTAISPRESGPSAIAGQAERVINAVDTMLSAGLPMIHPQCWRRAAVLHRYLRLNGVDTTIVFGVTTDPASGLEAHAWLEKEGAPYAERTPPTRYRRVFEFPERSVASPTP